jgi:glutathione-regulated potassium-efflux system ancillary protein KefF
MPENPNPLIYLVAAHPNWRASRVNRRLLSAAQALPQVRSCDLYSHYPDYRIDVAAEQAALQSAQLLLLVHPIHWYSMPALQKLWFDEVLSYGWAYGEGGQALRGKDLWLVLSTGGPFESYHPSSYNRYYFESFVPPYEQTAALCGMRFLPPLILHGAGEASEAALTTHVQQFEQQLSTYPVWASSTEQRTNAQPVPASARPRPEPTKS